jgi:hypothetical protein
MNGTNQISTNSYGNTALTQCYVFLERIRSVKWGIATCVGGTLNMLNYIHEMPTEMFENPVLGDVLLS